MNYFVRLISFNQFFNFGLHTATILLFLYICIYCLDLEYKIFNFFIFECN